MLRTAELDYELPEERIATHPVSPRDSARLMVLRRSEPKLVEHRQVRDLPQVLRTGDVLVVNRTRVVPARLRGVRIDTGGRAEGLFVHEASSKGDDRMRWQVLLKLRRGKPGVRIRLDAVLGLGREGEVHLRLVERAGADSGEAAAGWIVEVEGAPLGSSTAEILDQFGCTPLPPYILSARRKQDEVTVDGQDRREYQTVFAAERGAIESSVAAPTAGLHFTNELLETLRNGGIDRAEVELSVGMGTFKPVEAEFVEQHAMHAEWCCVPRETAEMIARSGAGEEGRRMIAVGTTTARTLESFDSPAEMLAGRSKLTRILITPGHHFHHVHGLMTNFHLPRSTLLAMVAAFLDDDDRVRGQGLPRLLAAYRLAIESGYRFYSFGDAMIILP